MHGGPGDAAGSDGVQHAQQHIAVTQGFRKVLDVHLVPQQAQQPHPERALLPRILRSSVVYKQCRQTTTSSISALCTSRDTRFQAINSYPLPF